MTDIFSNIAGKHQALYDEIAKSHPSLIRGRVVCSRCGTLRTVDPAQCLRTGWPKCCSATMGLVPAEETAEVPK